VLAQFDAALKAKDWKAIAALAVPEARDAVGRYYRSLADAGYVLVAATVRPGVPPEWADKPVLRSKEFVPPAVAWVDVVLDNPARYDRKEFLALGAAPGGRAYVISFLMPRGRAAAGSAIAKDGAFDYAALRAQVREAARAAWDAFRRRHPDRPPYVFALNSDDGAMTVVPAFNTEAALSERAATYGYASTAQVDAIRWAPGEWAFEGFGGEHFTVICDALAAAATGGRIKGGFAAHRKRVFAAAADALADLEASGAFGAGRARDGLTVFFTVSDADDAPKLQRGSARRANPRAVYDRFLTTGG
jgi:hypothetical protein